LQGMSAVLSVGVQLTQAISHHVLSTSKSTLMVSGKSISILGKGWPNLSTCGNGIYCGLTWCMTLYKL
jgi:hypothetical protein